MNDIRKKRIEALMVRELSNLIMKRRIKDDRIGFVSIVEIDLAADYSTATVYVSLFGSEAENADTWRGLTSSLYLFQAEMSRNLRLRLTPRLRLEIDNRIKEGDRLIRLIESR
jgi:ribosome-binding factor A